MEETPCECEICINRQSFWRGMMFSAVLACAAPATRAFAKAIETAERADDERFMRLALEEAVKGDFPFGAVIVKDARVLARGHNSGVSANDPTAHGEMKAIRNFVAARPAGELKGAVIYTTGEPCPMCMAAILWSGFGRVVYAASIDQLADKLNQIMIKSEAVAAATPFMDIEITGGVLSGEAMALFSR